MHEQPTITEMQAAMEATRLPPREGFARMVRDGLINARGELTRLFGGEAEPEPGANPSIADHINGEQ
jgi:hypothetical protein